MSSRPSSRRPASAAPASPLDASEDCILMLQGGGALGAYQADVFESLGKTYREPTWLAGTSAAISYYDTSRLRQTLERLVDFYLSNAGPVRLSVGAVNVRSGNFEYFDSTRQRIDARHIMASGALPPGFAPVEIDGEHFWDGGLVSNTPLQYVLDQPGKRRRVVFQVDLFAATGALPTTLAEVVEREKDIRFSSRTRRPRCAMTPIFARCRACAATARSMWCT